MQSARESGIVSRSSPQYLVERCIMNRLAFLKPTLAVLCAALVPAVRADVKLPNVIGSHMVLQRDKPLPIWGWAEAGEEVTVSFAGKSASAKADDKGNWKVTLPALAADGKAHQ